MQKLQLNNMLEVTFAFDKIGNLEELEALIRRAAKVSELPSRGIIIPPDN